jgi:undecaprenyl-diphosphatase
LTIVKAAAVRYRQTPWIPALFLFLNGLPSHARGLGPVAVWVAQAALAFYAPLLLGLWLRPGAQAAGRRRTALLAVLAAGLALSVNAVLNAAVPRPRPFLVLPAHVLVARPHDPSFPSDHAAVAFAVGVTLLLRAEPALGAAAVLGAALIGAARVMVGLHYPSDILGGMAVGAASAAALAVARGLLEPLLALLIALARRLRPGLTPAEACGRCEGGGALSRRLGETPP